MYSPVLKINNLTVAYHNNDVLLKAVREFSLELNQGEIYGIVGESGSGKTTLAMAIMHYLASGGEVLNGEIFFKGRNLLSRSSTEMEEIWGIDLCLVPQNPQTSLNPSIRVGDQISEIFTCHENLSNIEAYQQTLKLLTKVGFDDPERVAKCYPFQMSGGMQQRIVITMALATNPSLIIFDEPTTNLDVTTQASLLSLIRELIDEKNASAIYITHNLAVVAQICSRVSVMYAGELVEDVSIQGLRNPLHPYTRGLLESVSKLGDTKNRAPLVTMKGQIPNLADLPKGCIFAPRCPLKIDECEIRPQYLEVGDGHFLRCHRWHEIQNGEVEINFRDESSIKKIRSVDNLPVPSDHDQTVLQIQDLSVRYRDRSFSMDFIDQETPEFLAVDGVNLTINKGEIIGLVGESGSGKTTLSRAIVGLVQDRKGEINFLGKELPPALSDRELDTLKQMQMVFQNPDESLNPYHPIGETLHRPLKRLLGLTTVQANQRVKELLSSVRLPEEYADRKPSQLSGGEKQRIALARAFATNPQMLLADEPVSALDVSVRAAILNLFEQHHFVNNSSMLFISHDLSVVSYIADIVVVIYQGRIMEITRVEGLLLAPHHPYTEILLEAVPSFDKPNLRGKISLREETLDLTSNGMGCPFYTRCPHYLGEICKTEPPAWQTTASGKHIYCHIPINELVLINKKGSS